MEVKDFKKPALMAGGMVLGSVAVSALQSRVSKLNSNIGRIATGVASLAGAIICKSSVAQGLFLGMAGSIISGYAKEYLPSMAGLGDASMGELYQDENGVTYLMNGNGDYEQIDVPSIETVELEGATDGLGDIEQI
ncbi:MAG: hypothetical protein MJ069_09920 [Salinivirgaceae bacterium]|nr:hypothetical protein [Salinivirgaceae bacterium]